MLIPIDLQPLTDDGASLRTHIDRSERTRRALYADRRDRLLVQGSVVDVVPGLAKPNGDAAILIVLDFRFQSFSPSRRFKSAVINVHFAKANPSDIDPAVIRIAPDGQFSIEPQTGESTSKDLTNEELPSGKLGIFGKLPVKAEPAVDVDYISWKRSTTVVNDQATVLGLRTFMPSGEECNTATWMLKENPDSKSGIPTFLRTAVVLKRKDADVPFLANIEIKSTTDFASSIQAAFGISQASGISKVIFNPNTQSTTSTSSNYNKNYLEAEDLDVIWKVGNLTSSSDDLTSSGSPTLRQSDILQSRRNSRSDAP